MRMYCRDGHLVPSVLRLHPLHQAVQQIHRCRRRPDVEQAAARSADRMSALAKVADAGLHGDKLESPSREAADLLKTNTRIECAYLALQCQGTNLDSRSRSMPRRRQNTTAAQYIGSVRALCKPTSPWWDRPEHRCTLQTCGNLGQNAVNMSDCVLAQTVRPSLHR